MFTGQLRGSTLTFFQTGVNQIGQTLANDASTWVPITARHRRHRTDMWSANSVPACVQSSIALAS